MIRDEVIRQLDSTLKITNIIYWFDTNKSYSDKLGCDFEYKILCFETTKQRISFDEEFIIFDNGNLVTFMTYKELESIAFSPTDLFFDLFFCKKNYDWNVKVSIPIKKGDKK